MGGRVAYHAIPKIAASKKAKSSPSISTLVCRWLIRWFALRFLSLSGPDQSLQILQGFDEMEGDFRRCGDKPLKIGCPSFVQVFQLRDPVGDGTYSLHRRSNLQTVRPARTRDRRLGNAESWRSSAFPRSGHPQCGSFPERCPQLSQQFTRPAR